LQQVNKFMLRHTASPDQVDLVSQGRRDYHVKFRHPTIHREVLMPLTVIVGPEAQSGRGLLAIGGTHGDEYEGPVAIRRVMQEIDTRDVKGRLILLPVLSVCAFEAGVRDSPADGVNMNRAFPGDPKGTISSRTAHFVYAGLFPQVHVVQDVHAGGRVGRFSCFSSFHLWKDEVHRRAQERAARGYGTRFVVIHHNNDPGLLTVSAEQLGKVCIGGEFGWGRAIMRTGVDHARAGILSAAIDHGLLQERERYTRAAAVKEQVLLDASRPEAVSLANCSGHFEPRVELEQYVRCGDLLGYIHDFDRIDSAPEEVLAQMDGHVVFLAWEACVSKGQLVSEIGAPISWAEAGDHAHH
jgi:predicted deacylase